MSDYWKDCVEEALDELGIPSSEQQTKDLIEWIEGAHENYGTARGHDCIPNPLKEEIQKERAKTISAEKKAEQYRTDFVQNICMRRGCLPDEVTLEGGGHASIR